MRQLNTKKCANCDELLPLSLFVRTTNPFYPDGYAPFCVSCLEQFTNDGDWAEVDKLCRFLDIPFVPSEYTKAQNQSTYPFKLYAELFLEQEYASLDWSTYHSYYQELRNRKLLEAELPLLSEERRLQLRKKFGKRYDDDALEYLENLYQGLLDSQSVNGALSSDQALKLCRISYEIDEAIQEGRDFDKLITSYDRMMKTTNFSPKVTTSSADFESVGELFKYLSQLGWKPQYQISEPKDIVDETINNIQNWNRRLYVEESGIGDEITRRAETLRSIQEMEERNDNFYLDTLSDEELDAYDADGYDKLFGDDDFHAEVD